MADDVDHKLNELQAILGPKIQKLRLRYLIEPDAKSRQYLASRIHLLHARHCGSGIEGRFVPPSRAAADGPYRVGIVRYNYKPLFPFGLREEEWPQHIVVTGRSGSGKSNCVLGMVEQLLLQQKPFLLWSFKREYRGLLKAHPRQAPLYFTVGRPPVPFHFNPLIPPTGTNQDVWNSLISEAIAATYSLGEAASSVLRNGLADVCKNQERPTLLDLQRWIATNGAKGRAKEWTATVRRAIDALCSGTIGGVLNAGEPISLEWVLDKQVVLEVESVGDVERTALVQFVFRWLYRYALENFPKNQFRYALIIDEAHHVFGRAGTISGRENFSSYMLRMVREQSIGVLLVDQHPSLLIPQVMGNSHCSITLNLKMAADIQAIAGAMLLDTEQRHLVGMLPRGQAVVKLQDRYMRPFLISVPKSAASGVTVSDHAIEQHALVRLSGFGLSEGSSTGMGHLTGVPHSAESPVRTGEAAVSLGLTDEEAAFLQSVVLQPFLSLLERYQQLGLGIRKGDAVKRMVVRRGLVRPVRVQVPGNRVLLFELTEGGFDWCEERGLSVPAPRDGGVEHRFGVHRVSAWFSNHGFTIQREVKFTNGHVVDLVVARDGQRIAVEVETGKSDIAGNVAACLAEGLQNVIVLATNRSAFSKALRLKLAANWPAQVQVAYLAVGEQHA